MLDSIEKKKILGYSKDMWPRVSAHIKDILNFNFKSITMVEGWLIDQSMKTSSKTPVGWLERQPINCLNDVKELLRGVTEELRRLTSSVQPAIRTLFNAMDLQHMISTSAGQYSVNLKRPVCQGPTQLTSAAFTELFFNYAKTLEHADVSNKF